MSSTPVAVKLLLGPILIGAHLNTCLFGVSASQFTTYYASSRGRADSVVIRLLVFWEFIISAFDTATSVYFIWLYLVENLFNPAFLQSAPWPLTAVPLLTALSACPVQIFMACRVFQLSQSRVLFALLATLTVAHGAIAAATSLLAFEVADFNAGSALKPVADSWLGITVVNDLSITVFLIYYLNRSRTGFRRTDGVLVRLMRSALESAAFATFFSIMVLIMFTKFPATGFHLMFSQPMGRIYTSTLLSTLNNRESLRRDLVGGTYEFTESLNFRPTPNAAAVTVTEDTETERDVKGVQV
ncbi:hypothetical protein C8R47DRAFT_183518 [Mycena vitilis]|nr:hypothetical protein C8R47DRAFT_183518 [Mycena vitilis]